MPSLLRARCATRALGAHLPAPALLAPCVAWAALSLALLLNTGAAFAQPLGPQAAPSSTPAPDAHSPSAQWSDATRSAALLYDTLVAEIAAAEGDANSAIALLLEAARLSDERAGSGHAAAPAPAPADTQPDFADAVAAVDAQHLYQRAAQLALQSRSGPLALQVAHAWSQAHPRLSESNQYQLRVLLLLNRVADSLAPLQREIAATAPEQRLRGEGGGLYARIVQLYRNVSDKALAAAIVEKALQPDLGEPALAPFAWAAIGHLHHEAGQTAQAQAALSQSQTLAPNTLAAATLALILFEDGQHEHEAIITGYLAHDPAPITGLRLAYARVLRQASHLEKALPQLQHLLADNPANAHVWHELALLHDQYGQRALALQAMREHIRLLQHAALSAAPGADDAPPAASDTAPLAAPPLSRSNPHAPALVDAYLLGGHLAAKAGDIAQATIWLQALAHLTPEGNEAPLGSEGDDGIVSDSDTREHSSATSATNAAPSSTISARTLRLSTQHPALGRLHAHILLHTRGLSAARALLHQGAAQSIPALRRAWRLADIQLLRDSGQLQSAWRLQQQLHRAEPDDIDLAYDTAVLAELAGHWSEMERILRGIIRTQSDHHHARNLLGYSLAQRGQRLGQARELLEAALAYAPQDPHIIDSMGWLEYRAGQPQRAIELLRTAYNLLHDVDISTHLAEVLWSSGQRDEALTLLSEARQRNPESAVLQETLKRLKINLP